MMKWECIDFYDTFEKLYMALDHFIINIMILIQIYQFSGSEKIITISFITKQTYAMPTEFMISIYCFVIVFRVKFHFGIASSKIKTKKTSMEN